MRLSQGKSKIKPLKSGYNDYRKASNILDDIKKDNDIDMLSGSTLSSTQVSNTQESSTQVSDTQKSSTQVSDTQKSSTQVSDTQKSSTQESSTQVSDTQESSTQMSDTQESSTQVSDTQESSTQVSDTQESSTQVSDTQESSTQMSDTQESSTQMSDTQESSTQMSDTQESSTQMSDTQESSTHASGTQESNTLKVATLCDSLLVEKNMLALTDKAVDARLTSAQVRFLKYLISETDWSFGEWFHFPKSKTMEDLKIGPTQLKRLQDHFLEREVLEKCFKKATEREGKIGGQKGLHYKVNKNELLEYLS